MGKLFTIGYEGATIDEFIAILFDWDIEHLIDVRDFPTSRKKGFSKNLLAESLNNYGIEYTHLKGLGDPKEGGNAARAGKHNLFFENIQ
jgi:uncharacterized protein (DUF488 family)